MHVCMYTCIKYVCMYVCMCVRMYLCMYVCMYVWTIIPGRMGGNDPKFDHVSIELPGNLGISLLGSFCILEANPNPFWDDER